MNDEYTIELDLDVDIRDAAIHASARKIYMLYMGIYPGNGYPCFRFKGPAAELRGLLKYYGFEDDLQTYIVD